MKKTAFFSFRRLVMIGLLVAGTALISSCNKHDNDNSRVPAARLLAFNLVPDKAAGIAIALSGNAITGTPLSYTSFTGYYLNIYTGQRQVQAYDAANTSTPLTSTSFNFADSSYYSLFVTGANNNYSNVVVRDNFDKLTTTGQAYIRYINAIPDSTHPAVSIVAGETTIVNTPVAYASVSDFTSVGPGSIVITASNGGTTLANRTITLEQNKVYTVLLAGVPGGTGDQAIQIKYVENGTLVP